MLRCFRVNCKRSTLLLPLFSLSLSPFQPRLLHRITLTFLPPAERTMTTLVLEQTVLPTSTTPSTLVIGSSTTNAPLIARHALSPFPLLVHSLTQLTPTVHSIIKLHSSPLSHRLCPPPNHPIRTSLPFNPTSRHHYWRDNNRLVGV